MWWDIGSQVCDYSKEHREKNGSKTHQRTRTRLVSTTDAELRAGEGA